MDEKKLQRLGWSNDSSKKAYRQWTSSRSGKSINIL